MDLILRESYPLDASEKNKVNLGLDKIINEYKNNADTIQKLMSEAISLARSVEARADSLKKQGVLGRFLGDLLGSNHKASANNQKDLATAQYISQQLLIKVSEQNLITLKMVEDLRQKLHRLAVEQASMAKKQNEIKDYVTDILDLFFIKIRDRFDRIENQANLNSWTNYIVDHEILGNKTYCQLSVPARLMCLANDFFNLTKGRWDKKELAILKSTMRLVDVDPKAELAPIELFKSYQKEPSLLNKLFENIVDYDDFKDQSYDTSLLIGFTKIDYLKREGQENFNELVQLIGDKTKNEVEISAVTNEILWAGGDNPTDSISASSIVEMLLLDLKRVHKIKLEGTGLPRLSSNASYPSRKHLECKIMESVELKNAADKGNALAQYFYAQHLEKVAEGDELDDDIYLYYQMSAEQGLSESLYETGMCLYLGSGIEKDEPEAFELYKKSTFSDNPIKIGLHADDYDDDTKEGAVKRAKLTMLAAKMGDEGSMHSISKLLQEGTGIKKDIKKSIYWLQKSADKGLPIARYELSECYRLGKGVEKDIAFAYTWCHVAGESCDNHDQYEPAVDQLFSVYDYESDTDSTQKLAFYLKAAEKGLAIAQYKLAKCYQFGWGTEENEELRLHWLQMASDNSLLDAQKDLLLILYFQFSDYRDLLSDKYDSIRELILEKKMDLIIEGGVVESNYSDDNFNHQLKTTDEYVLYSKSVTQLLDLAKKLVNKGCPNAMSTVAEAYAGYGDFDLPTESAMWYKASALLGDEVSIRSFADAHIFTQYDENMQEILPDKSDSIFWNRFSLFRNKETGLECFADIAKQQLAELGYH